MALWSQEPAEQNVYGYITHSVMGLAPFSFITPTIYHLSYMKLCCLLMRGPKYVVCSHEGVSDSYYSQYFRWPLRGLNLCFCS